MTAQRVPGFEATKDSKDWSLERERLLEGWKAAVRGVLATAGG